MFKFYDEVKALVLRQLEIKNIFDKISLFQESHL